MFVMVGASASSRTCTGSSLATWQQVTKAPHPIDLGRTLFAGLFLALALIGNVLGKVRRNFYIGVRVPWTLASDRVWNDTHRVAAWTMVGGSLVGFLRRRRRPIPWHSRDRGADRLDGDPRSFIPSCITSGLRSEGRCEGEP